MVFPTLDSSTLAAVTLCASSPLPSACSPHEQKVLSKLIVLVPDLHLSSTTQFCQLVE